MGVRTWQSIGDGPAECLVDVRSVTPPALAITVTPGMVSPGAMATFTVTSTKPSTNLSAGVRMATPLSVALTESVAGTIAGGASTAMLSLPGTGSGAMELSVTVTAAATVSGDPRITATLQPDSASPDRFSLEDGRTGG